MPPLLAALDQLDARAFLLLNQARHPLLDLLMPALSHKQYLVLPAAVALLLVVRAGSRRAWLLLAAALLAVGAGDLAASLLKPLVHRVRPCHVLAAAHLLAGCTASLSLPSNHATNMAALAAVGWAGARGLGVALTVLALGVGWSRVYLGVHYPGDVLAGLLLGGALGTLAAGAARRALAAWPPGAEPVAPARNRNARA